MKINCVELCLLDKPPIVGLGVGWEQSRSAGRITIGDQILPSLTPKSWSFCLLPSTLYPLPSTFYSRPSVLAVDRLGVQLASF